MADEKFKITEEEKYIIIMPHSQIEDDQVSDFSETMKELCENRHKNIVLDFMNIKYLSSRAIAVLVFSYKIQHKKGKQIVIINANEYLHNNLKAVNIPSVIPVLDENKFKVWQTDMNEFKSKKAHILEVKSEEQEGITVIWLEGDIESINSLDLKSCFTDGFSDIKNNNAIVDLHNIISLDEQSIIPFTDLHNKISENDGKVVLAGANEAVKEFIGNSKLSEHFLFSDNIESGKKFLLS